MKLQITRTFERKETIDVELPYYYKQDLMLDEVDSVIYGKIDEDCTTTIQITYNYRGKVRFELEINAVPADYFSCYMIGEYKSNKGEYLEANAKMLAAVQDEIAKEGEER